MAIESARKIKALIVDDSALIRSLLTEILTASGKIQVVGAAEDPFDAREQIKLLNPDVITLDIEMPKMNGISFLKNLMRLRPMPVVMISTLTHAGAPATLEALSLGAVDFVGKPKQESGVSLSNQAGIIVEKVLAAAGANVTTLASAPKAVAPFSLAGKTLKPNFICAIGASTGGTEAIKAVLSQMPAGSPPVVITQHIPAAFSSSFAQRLNNNSEMSVCEAEQDMPVKVGCAYLAPGDQHLRVVRGRGGYVCKLDDSDPVNRHRPSVEVLFDSVLEAAGTKAMGVILTGMGADGAKSLLRMREAGCATVAQDEATSVVWGMPGAAVAVEAAVKVLPLDKISKFILYQAVADRSIK
jgi:two-component system chemotaxis response regulator CheB